MKAFELIKNYQCQYPDKMKLDIIKQLEMCGKINISQKQLEELCSSLNKDCYEELFEQFANWLSEKGGLDEVCR